MNNFISSVSEKKKEKLRYTSLLSSPVKIKNFDVEKEIICR